MKKTIIYFFILSFILTGCYKQPGVLENTHESTYENINQNTSNINENYFSNRRKPVSSVNIKNKTNEKSVKEIIDKHKPACEITTYEYDMFINYESYWQNYTNADDHPSYEYITDYLNLHSDFDFIYPLYYAGWPYGEIWKYNSFGFNENNFTLWDIYNVPKNNKNHIYSCWVRGYLENGYVVKTFSYKKDNIESTIENYRTKNDNVYQLFFKKNNEYIYGIKPKDGKWEFFTDKNDINHFYKTMAFYYFTTEPSAE